MLEILIKSESFWIVISVLIGFFLGEGTRWIREKLRIRRLIIMIKEELKLIKKQIKKNLNEINEIINILKKKEYPVILPLMHINICYTKFVSEIYEHLPYKKRGSLHFIYNSLEQIDRVVKSTQELLSSLNIKDVSIDYIKELCEANIGNIKTVYSDINENIDYYLDASK